MISFAYSFDRDRWFGSYPSREQAIEAGSDAATQYPNPPTTLYIGQRVAADIRSADSAQRLIAETRRRAREEYGEQADGFLRNVSDNQVNQLEAAIESTVHNWLERNQLQPTWSKIGRITEHPVQTRTLCVTSRSSSTRDTHGPDDVASIGEIPSNW
jgi:hypothetical protein